MPRAARHEEAPPEVAQIEPQPEEGSWEQVRGLVDAIQPGDWTRLVIFLQTYGNYQDQIIAEAQAVLGNATVDLALQQLGLQPRAQEQQQQQDTSAQDAAAVTALYEDSPDSMRGQAPTESAAETMAELDQQQQQQQDPTPLDKALLLVMTVETAEDLAALLKSHPQYREQLVQEAQKSLSSDAIARAIQMADAPAAQEKEEQAPPPPPTDGPKPGDAPTVNTEPQSEADLQQEPAWISKARAYNFSDDHIADSVEFNNLTNGAFLANGQPDPVQIAAWQQENGLEPDGKIGDQTLAKAQQMLKKPQTQAPAPEDLIPEDEMRNEVE